MISDIVMVGISKNNLADGFRIFDVDSVDPLTERRINSLIKVVYWTKEKDSRLTRIKFGTPVVIRGRLEADDEHGLYVVAETIYLCS